MASVMINFTDSASQIEAYSARVGARVTAIGESATWVIEFGPTTTYGKKSQSEFVEPDTYLQTSFTITGLQPNTLYHYRCRATGSKTGVVNGPDRTFTTTAHEDVVVTLPPVADDGALVPLGDYFRLDATVDSGSWPYTYQWKRNGVNRGASSYYDSFTLQKITTADAGTWSFEVSNPGSKTTSPGKLITVVSAISMSKIVAEGGSVTSTVTLTPPNPAATYQWRLNGQPLTSALGTVTGADSSKLTIIDLKGEADGDYTCRVTAGADTLELEVGQLQIGLKPVINQETDKTYRVSEPVDIYISTENSPTSITVSKLPAGLKYVPTQQRITGRPTAAGALPVTIFGTNKYGKGQSMTFNIAVNALAPGVVGTFEGLVSRYVEPRELGGKGRFTIASTGAITGTVVVGAGTYLINTVVNASTTSDEVSFYLQEVKSGLNPKLQISATFDNNSFNGSVSSSTGGGSLDGYRNIWSKTSPPPSIGDFNALFTPQSSWLSDPAAPHGHSYATFKVADTGLVSITGRMADGTTTTGSSIFGPLGEMPLFIPIYSNRGSLLGTPVITGTAVGGICSWNKNLAAGGRAYTSGFSLVGLDVTGSKYLKPVPTLGQRFLGLAATAQNAVMNFSDATLSSALNLPLTVTDKNAPVYVLPNTYSLSVKIDAATGLVSGTFKVTDSNPILSGKTVTRTGTWYGLVIPSQDRAAGFFTLPDLPAAGPPTSLTNIATNPLRSGIFEMTKPPVGP